MADLSALAKVTEYFASGKTKRDCILRRYGTPTTLPSGSRGKGPFEASPITLFVDPRAQQLRQDGGGAVQDYDRVFYTLAQARGADEYSGAQGDELVMVEPDDEAGDIYQIERLAPWRDGPGDEIFVKRVGKVGHAPY